MNPVNIAELKNRLSHYLRLVRGGQPVLVADRDRVIARIDPVVGTPADAGEEHRLAELEQRGTLRRPRHRLATDWLKRPESQADVVAALLAERDQGR